MTESWRKPAKAAGAMVMLGGLVTHIATGTGAWIIVVGLAVVIVAAIER